MQIFFAVFLPTISQAIQCNEGLKLRKSASQCWDKNILQKLEPKTPRTALASLPGMKVLFIEFHTNFTWSS